MSPLTWAFVASISAVLLASAWPEWGRLHVRRAGSRNRPRSGDPSLLWCLWIGLPIGGGVLGLVAVGHPALGAVVGLGFPSTAAAVLRWRRKRRQREWEDSAVVFLFGLHGLLRAGLSLPSALARLGERGEGEFAVQLSRSLGRFEGGRPLADCLESARRGYADGPAALCLGILESGYRQGVPVVPFLDRVLPWLEEERRLRLRAEELRQTALAQAAVAALLPWGVASFAAGSPGGWASGAKAAAVGAVALQALGFWGLRRWCLYE